MRLFARTFIVAALLGSSLAWAQDVHNLTEGHPTLIEDAYPTPMDESHFLLQLAFFNDEDVDVVLLEPGFQLGLASDWHARLSVPFFWVDGESDTGDVRLQVLWGNKGQNDPDTAFAIAGEAHFPTGDSGGDVDLLLKLILTHPLDQTDARSRLHLNLGFLEGDNDGVIFGAGYSQMTARDMAFILDLINSDPEFGPTSTIFELGLRKQFGAKSVGSLGLSLGVNNAAPDFGIVFGWQAKL